SWSCSLAWLPSILRILLICLSTPIKSKQAANPCPLFSTEMVRAGRDYSQGKRRTQGKIAKKAVKMRVFLNGCGNSSQKCGLEPFPCAAGPRWQLDRLRSVPADGAALARVRA